MERARILLFAILVGIMFASNVASGASPPAVPPTPQAASTSTTPPVAFDKALAERLGADKRGMRQYVLVILKTGPTRVPDGEKRKAMFAGHFANMERLAKTGKLVIAGPFTEDPQGWRGLYVFAVEKVEEAQALVATDPVISNGEMVAEYHRWYGSAGAMMLPEVHERLTPPAN